MITRGDVTGWAFILKDVLSGAEISQGFVHPFEPGRKDLLSDGNAYVFKPPISIKPGTMIVFRHDDHRPEDEEREPERDD